MATNQMIKRLINKHFFLLIYLYFIIYFLKNFENIMIVNNFLNMT